MKYQLTSRKNTNFFIFIAIAVLVLISLSIYMVSHLVDARKNVDLQKSALAVEGAIYQNQLLIQAQVLSAPNALVGPGNQFNNLASNIFKENSSIVLLELRNASGGLIAKVQSSLYDIKIFSSRKSLPPWLLHQYIEAVRKKSPSYSSPYNSELLFPSGDINHPEYFMEQHIPLGDARRMLVLIIRPQAWFLESNVVQVLSGLKSQEFLIQTQNGLNIASSRTELPRVAAVISSIHVPLELPGLSLSLLAQEHETMIGEVDSIVPFVGGLCAFIVLLLTLFLRALYLQLQAEHRLRNQEDLMLDQARLASLGEMTSVLSHELNQPIATIETYACAAKNLLAEGWSDEERASKQSQMLTALNMVTDQSHRAAEIIKSIRKLFASKSTSYEDVLISDILDNLYPIIAVQAERFQSKFKITYSGNYLLRVNRLLCEQVFLNLSRNAFQAMIKTPPSQRSLQVSVGISKNNFCKISFIDNGEGLSEEAAKNIFKPFFSSKADGMGLGLSLSRTLVERFGGELRWKNTSPRGAQFTILLPIQD